MGQGGQQNLYGDQIPPKVFSTIPSSHQQL